MKKSLLSINPKVRKAQANKKRHFFKNGIFLISSGWAIPVFYSLLRFLAFWEWVPEDFKLFQLFFEKQVSYGLLSLGLLRGEVFLSSHDSHIVRRSDPAADHQNHEEGITMSTVMTEQRCYTVKDLQKILGLSRPVVYELLKRNEFRWIMIGGKYRISKKSFDEWLDGTADSWIWQKMVDCPATNCLFSTS